MKPDGYFWVTFLTIFEASSIFWGSWAVAKIVRGLKPNHQYQVKLVQVPDSNCTITIHINSSSIFGKRMLTVWAEQELMHTYVCTHVEEREEATYVWIFTFVHSLFFSIFHFLTFSSFSSSICFFTFNELGLFVAKFLHQAPNAICKKLIILFYRKSWMLLLTKSALGCIFWVYSFCILIKHSLLECFLYFPSCLHVLPFHPSIFFFLSFFHLLFNALNFVYF